VRSFDAEIRVDKSDARTDTGIVDRAELRRKFEALPDAELVCALLALHKTIAVQARCRQRELLNLETALLSATLERLVDPVTLARALILWEDGDPSRVVPFHSR
jgi:hypothetical protein